MYAIYFFQRTTAAPQKYNLKNPVDPDAAYRLLYTNDDPAAHTLNGYVLSSASSRYASTKYPIVSPVDFHISAFNITSENATGDHVLMGSQEGAAGSMLIHVGRNFAANTAACMSTTPYTIAGYDRTKKGLLLSSRSSLSLMEIYDAGALIRTQTATVTAPVAAVKSPILIGAFAHLPG